MFSGWQARLKLGFTRSGNKTVLTQRQHTGPLVVQRPFYPEQGVCHVYLLHPPGGVVGGDHLQIAIHADQQAQALITTPGAAKFYRSTQPALQSVTMQVDDHACLEWLPQETIIYEGARVESRIHLDLADQARFIGWDITALGRPAAGEQFESGQALISWHVTRNNTVVFIEKMNLDANAFTANWGLNASSSCGSLFACPASRDHLHVVRELIGSAPQRGVTLIGDLLVCRASDAQSRSVRQFFEQVRGILRKDILRSDDYKPRIWAT